MRRVRMTAPGFEHPLVVEDVEDLPPPGAGEVILAVEACGVCHRDLIDRAGRVPFLQTPITPGHEVVGRVIAVGPEVSWRVGDRVGTMHRDACGACPACLAGQTSLCPYAGHVYGILADGGYATQLRAIDSSLYALPDDLSASAAAILHCTFGTAYRDLVTLGHLVAGERVLITGANGGVGSAAVQIASRLGAHVIAAVRDGAHADWLRALGAAEVVVSTDLRDVRGLHAVDLALDAVGAVTFPGVLRALRVGGRVVVVGNIAAERVQLNLGQLIVTGLTVIGGSGATAADMAAVLALHRAAPFAFHIDRELPLEAAEDAHTALRAGGVRGRIVLRGA